MTTFAPIHSTELNKLIFNGADLSSGLGEDTYLEFTPNSTLTTVGTDAGSKERYISANADNSGTMVLTLNTQSPTNLKLNAMVTEARKDGNKPLIGDFYIQRGGTLFLYEAKGCHLMERPTQSIGRDMATNTQTWTFDVAEMNEVDINDVEINVDLKASIKGEIAAAIELSITI